MTRRDAFDADLFSVFDDEAGAPIPGGGLERLEAAIANRQPRPARLARLGGRWIGDRSAVTAPVGALRATMPVLRFSGAVLLLLLSLALIGAAALIGGRLLERPPDPEKLLYGLDGNIYLAEGDGRNPTMVAEGADLLSGSPWAPDGRHFLSFDSVRLTADIRDPAGQMVSSFGNLPGFNGLPVWSPDSSRLQAWTQSYRQINIYGIDGVLQAELPLPEGYSRVYEELGVWAPDGRSVWVLIAKDQDYPCTSSSSGTVTDLDPPPCAAKEVWALPIDGSAPRRVAEDGAVNPFPPSFTPDGTRMAFGGRDGNQPKLYVATADGSDPRSVGMGNLPTWSPSGEQLAYFVWSAVDEQKVDLMVIDVVTETARTLVADWQYADWPPFSWSQDGARILFSRQDGPQTQEGPPSGSLWTVGIEGGDATVLVEGATHGAWQPAPPPRTAAPTPSLTPTLTPRPKADLAKHMVAALDELQRAWTANDVNTTFNLLGIEAAWVMDRLPASWMDDPAGPEEDPAIAAYVDAVHVLVGVLPDTPAWDEAWASYFSTRPALAALVPAQSPTPAP